MKQLFRPIVLFKNMYVDLSYLIGSIFFVFLLGILYRSYQFDPMMDPLLMATGTCAGMFSGTSVVLWELFRYKKRSMKDIFHLSCLPSIVDTIYIMLIVITMRMDWNVAIFFALFGYQFSQLVCLFIIERRIKKRFRWIEFYPK